jgi:uridine kinase
MSQRLAPVALAALRARLVLIGGVSRSGKSHAAQVLKELVGNRGRTAHVLSLDSWLRPSTERVEGAGVLSRFDVTKAVNDIGRVVDSTVRTRFSTSIYDRAARAMHPTVVELSVAADDIIIIEGVPALLIEPLRALAQVTVHLEVPETERVARLKADYRWRGYSEQSIDELIALRAKDENVPVNAAGELADYAITSESER